MPILEDASGQTIDVGRKTRTIPPALRRALEARDGGCRFPGCSNRRFVDAHHVRHWVDGGTTDLDNTILLCRRHHRALHEHGFAMERVDGGWRFLDPDGRIIPDVPLRPLLGGGAVERTDRDLRAVGVVIDARSNLPGWDGLPVDYAMCVGALGELDGAGREM